MGEAPQSSGGDQVERIFYTEELALHSVCNVYRSLLYLNTNTVVFGHLFRIISVAYASFLEPKELRRCFVTSSKLQ